MSAQPSSRWFPTKEQLKDPESLERSVRQILTQHYRLQDQFNAMANERRTGAERTNTSPFPPGSGPADSMLLGLHVAPVDTETLADGTKLTYVKASGNFQFI